MNGALGSGAAQAPGAVGPVWTAVCRLGDLARERGAAALVDGEQVALFRLVDDTVLAVQQRDPFSGAHVMSRGIVGSRGDVPTVASPMYKQVFDLRTGRCLDAVGREPQDLRTWPVRLDGDVVLVGASPVPRAPSPPAWSSPAWSARAGSPAAGRPDERAAP